MFIKQPLKKLKNYKMAKKNTRYLFRVEQEVIDQLKLIAKKNPGTSVSELIRTAVKDKYKL